MTNGPVDEVTWAIFYQRFKVVEELQTDMPPTPPIVRQVIENTHRIRSLDLKFYAILAGVGSATVLGALFRLLG
jgi:hypothetical protein